MTLRTGKYPLHEPKKVEVDELQGSYEASRIVRLGLQGYRTWMAKLAAEKDATGKRSGVRALGRSSRALDSTTATVAVLLP